MIASVQSTASQTSLPAGTPRNSARAASTMVVNGLCSAIGCSQLGILSTGTNADETNVSGKRTVNPYAFDASGDEEERPMKAKTHENAYPIASTNAIPAITSTTLLEKLKPISSPTVNITTNWKTLVTMSPSVRPVSSAERVIGSERNLSISPFLRSSASPSAVTKPPKTIDWTMIPGIRKST